MEAKKYYSTKSQDTYWLKIVGNTKKAVYVYQKSPLEAVWLPKSQIREVGSQAGFTQFLIPVWLSARHFIDKNFKPEDFKPEEALKPVFQLVTDEAYAHARKYKNFNVDKFLDWFGALPAKQQLFLVTKDMTGRTRAMREDRKADERMILMKIDDTELKNTWSLIANY